MCGIAGGFRVDRTMVDRAVVSRMTDALAHRGPDGAGLREGPGYVLGHRRLSIVDLTGGAQPMTDGHGLWVTFNGEIYNHLELRQELEARGFRFQTRSDTEVLLHGYRAYGTDLPKMLRGMFAFVMVDELDHSLFACRDRMGKKPLLYAEQDGTFWFASEAKGLLTAGVDRQLDQDAIAQFFCLRYVPEPQTAFARIRKLPAGSSLVLDGGGIRLSRYWTLSFAPPAKPVVRADAEVQMLALLDEAVSIRRMSEVPLGAFLSGGIDSQAVVESLVRQGDGTKVVACGIGFSDPRFDELPFIRTAARRLGADLHEAVLDPSDMADLQWFDRTFDEPFADASAIPTYHVSRLARRAVTVALSGDGGDESFGGYRRYRFDRIENRIRGLLPSVLWSTLGSLYPKLDFAPRWLRFKRTLQNLALPADLAYARSVSANLPEQVLPLLHHRHDVADPLRRVRAAYRDNDAEDPLHRAQACDFATWLPGDILTKVDRASMAVSLEVRCPFLDHKLVEAAARLPASWHLAGGTTKAFLRNALSHRLDQDTLTRPKQGFSVPLADWLRGPMGEELRDGPTLERLAPFLDPGQLAIRLDRHRQGLKDHAELLWAAIVFARFLERHVP